MVGLKVKYNGSSSPVGLVNGKTYKVESIERGWYRIIDESGEDYLYHPMFFEILEINQKEQENIKKQKTVPFTAVFKEVAEQ